MKKSKVSIRLMGHELALVTDQNPEDVQRIARYVDRKMREIAIVTRAGDTLVPVLTSMTLAEELFRAQDENTRLKRELASLTKADEDTQK